jgi:hypothetical protein
MNLQQAITKSPIHAADLDSAAWDIKVREVGGKYVVSSVLHKFADRPKSLGFHQEETYTSIEDVEESMGELYVSYPHLRTAWGAIVALTPQLPEAH